MNNLLKWATAAVLAMLMTANITSCSKDDDNNGGSGKYGSFQISANDLGGNPVKETLKVNDAAIQLNYDTDGTTIKSVRLILSSDVSSDSFATQPKEYLDIVFEPSGSSYQMKTSLYFPPVSNATVSTTRSILVKRPSPVNLMNSSYTYDTQFSYNPQQKSFSLSLRQGSGSNYVISGSAKGNYKTRKTLE